MAEPRILIVDDDPEVVEALKAAFAGKPWEVESATVASVGLSKHLKHPFDLLIVDKNLPDLDGVELIRQLRADHDRVRIVVLTGYASAESAVETLNLAIDAYLLKPFASIDVVETVEDVLARAPAASGDAAPVFDVDPEWADRAETQAVPPPGKADSRTRTKPAIPVPLDTVEEVAFRLLIASADPRARASLASVIEPGSSDILFASDVTELMDLITSKPLGLVLLHGALDAAEVVARIRARSPELPCVVMAEAAGLGTVTWLIELRITALLTEPPDSPAIGRRLNEIVRNLRSRLLRPAAAGATP